ncbi:MAG: hemerythrin domain-containing protein [Acidimicrobiales bacterium]
MTATIAPITSSLPSAEWPEFLEGIIVLHGGMRRDVDRLPVAIERTTDRSGAVAIQRWFAKFEREVVHHHEREDDVVWPILLEAAPEFGDPLGQLEEDHHGLDAAMTATRQALDALTATYSYDTCVAAADAARALARLLHDHLDREEAAMFPAMARVFTAESFEQLEQELLKATPKRLFAFELPFAFDGLAADRVTSTLAEMPALIRLVHRFVWQPRYDRLVAPLRAG